MVYPVGQQQIAVCVSLEYCEERLYGFACAFQVEEEQNFYARM